MKNKITEPDEKIMNFVRDRILDLPGFPIIPGTFQSYKFLQKQISIEIQSLITSIKQEERERCKDELRRVIQPLKDSKEYRNLRLESQDEKELYLIETVEEIIQSLTEEDGRCKQCQLEGNTGVCDRSDCINHPTEEDVTNSK